MIQICIDKENILDLIYLYKIYDNILGGQNILSPPHIFEWGGGVRYPPPPPPPSDAPIYMLYTV